MRSHDEGDFEEWWGVEVPLFSDSPGRGPKILEQDGGMVVKMKHLIGPELIFIRFRVISPPFEVMLRRFGVILTRF
jgi:hypothetical protein